MLVVRLQRCSRAGGFPAAGSGRSAHALAPGPFAARPLRSTRTYWAPCLP